MVSSIFDEPNNHLCAIPNIAELIITDGSSKTPRTDPQTSPTSSALLSPTQAGPPPAPQSHWPDTIGPPNTSVPCSPARASSPRPSAVVIRARTLLPPLPDSCHDRHGPSSEAADAQTRAFLGLRSLSGPIHVVYKCRDLLGGAIQELSVQVPPGTLSEKEMAKMLAEVIEASRPTSRLIVEISEGEVDALCEALVRQLSRSIITVTTRSSYKMYSATSANEG